MVSFKTNSPDPSRDLVTITIDVNPGMQSFGTYIQNKISDEMKLYSNLHILKGELTTLGGNPGYRLVYSIQNPLTRDIQIGTHIWTINNNTGYDFSNFVLLKYYPDSLPIVKKLIDSFEFISKTNNDADN